MHRTKEAGFTSRSEKSSEGLAQLLSGKQTGAQRTNPRRKGPRPPWISALGQVCEDEGWGYTELERGSDLRASKRKLCLLSERESKRNLLLAWPHHDPCVSHAMSSSVKSSEENMKLRLVEGTRFIEKTCPGAPGATRLHGVPTVGTAQGSENSPSPPSRPGQV